MIALSAGPPQSKVEASSASPERIAELTQELVAKMLEASKAIADVNSQTRLLSFNAQIEAARAGGGVGAAFGVVASAIRDLSDKTAGISSRLQKETQEASNTLQDIIQTLATNVRGTRLSSLALTNIDLVDRNLYERSCDVRWWATDSSVVDALSMNSSESYAYCSSRLGMILNSYTVYYDLVLCDMNGIVVSNGRPNQYGSVGTNCSNAQWFTSALETSTGEQFGFESVHRSRLVGNDRVLIYSCTVREGGQIDGAPLGVLGIVFNWDALAQTIVHATPLSIEEKQSTRVCLVDDSGLVLADTSGRSLEDTITLAHWEDIKRRELGFTKTHYRGRDCTVGFAQSPGYETYSTGWHSLLIQD